MNTFTKALLPGAALAALLASGSLPAAELHLGNVALLNAGGEPGAITFRIDTNIVVENVGYKDFPAAVSLEAGWHSIAMYAAGDANREIIASSSFFLSSENAKTSVLSIGGSENQPLRLLPIAMRNDCDDQFCTSTLHLSPTAQSLNVERRCRSRNEDSVSSSSSAGTLRYMDTNGGSRSQSRQPQTCELDALATEPSLSWLTTSFDLPLTGSTQFMIIGDNVLAPPEIIAVSNGQPISGTERSPDPLAGIASTALWRDLDEAGAAYMLLEIPEGRRITGTAQIFDDEGNSTWRVIDGSFADRESQQTGSLQLTQLAVERSDQGHGIVSTLPSIQLVYNDCNSATVTIVDGTLTTRRIERTKPVETCLVSGP